MDGSMAGAKENKIKCDDGRCARDLDRGPITLSNCTMCILQQAQLTYTPSVHEQTIHFLFKKVLLSSSTVGEKTKSQGNIFTPIFHLESYTQLKYHSRVDIVCQKSQPTKTKVESKVTKKSWAWWVWGCSSTGDSGSIPT